MCIFCEIVNNKIPNYKIYKGNNCIAILDAYPIEKGHTLVISKIHYKNYLDVDIATLSEINIIMKNIMNKGIKNMNVDGYNIITNINKTAGQEVFHFHWHLIPRYKKNQKNFKSKRITLSNNEMNNIKNKLLLD